MSSSIPQHIIYSEKPYLPISTFSARALTSAIVDIRLLDADKLGIATQLSETGVVEAVAFATHEKVIYITFSDVSVTQKAASATSGLAKILASEMATIAGFSMARQAIHIRRDLGHRVRGVDLSTALAPSTTVPWAPADFVKNKVFADANRFDILELWYPTVDDEAKMQHLCLQAWLAALCSDHCGSELRMVDTRNLLSNELACIGGLLRSVELLEQAKPLKAENDFKAIDKLTDTDGLYLENARFKTRVRRSENTAIVLTTTSGQHIIGQATQSAGRTTMIRIIEGTYRGDIERVRVEGREESTCSENARDEFILRLLQGKICIRDSQFIDLMWFPPSSFSRQTRPKHTIPSFEAFSELNDSQRQVSAAMISETEQFVVAHGPPGTGKTTTISAAVNWWKVNDQPVYIVAQSNVGVKNIARSLVKKGLLNFKLLVSKEFYLEWHEPLYNKITHTVIRSDEFRIRDPSETALMLGGSRIILCTLSMLSNPALLDCGIFDIVPLERLVVDEASQIEVSQYMHLFHKFYKLKKVCAFGDPKQLPPYGRDVAPESQSVFEIPHLKARAYFLNTQYRMPVPLGNFISQNVYNNKLKSVHDIKDTSCVAFVDVWKGAEESVGKSWKNTEEVNTVVTLVKEYYQRHNFCIITPYDAQRAAIVNALEAQGLKSDCVYNVDSFQGHEAPYVLLSTVRTTCPGFLAIQERTNVMLTRCEAGMVIVSNKAFVRGNAAKWTLLGKLATHWAEHAKSDVWVDWRGVAARTVDLPGARAPSRLVLPPITTLPSRTVPSAHMNTSNRRPHPAGGPSTNGAEARLATAEALSAGMEGLRLIQTQGTASARARELQKQKHDATVRRNQNFPSLGDDSELPKNVVKGRWRQGSEAVKYCW